MLEKNFQTRFSHWLEATWPPDVSARFELKFVNLSKEKTLNFKSKIPAHQLRALSAKRHIFKLPDLGCQNPYDCYHISGQGFLVVQFWKRAVKHFYIIKIEKIIKSIESGFKGMSEEAANMIGVKCYLDKPLVSAIP